MSSPARIKNFLDLEAGVTKDNIGRIIVRTGNLTFRVRDAKVFDECFGDPSFSFLLVTWRKIRNGIFEVFNALRQEFLVVHDVSDLTLYRFQYAV